MAELLSLVRMIITLPDCDRRIGSEHRVPQESAISEQCILSSVLKYRLFCDERHSRLPTDDVFLA